jgi:membrane protein implicated in regulation of membrane protease activity
MDRRTDFRTPTGNPVANGLVMVAGLAAIAASIIVGFFAFVIIGGLLLVLAAIFGVRLWWYRFKLRRSGDTSPRERQTSRGDPSMIEGEYTVVEPGSRERRGPGA